MCCVYLHAKLLQLCRTLYDPRDYMARQAPLFMGFSRQGYWSELSCHPPGDLPNPRIEPVSLMSPAFSDRFFTTSATWEAPYMCIIATCYIQLYTLYLICYYHYVSLFYISYIYIYILLL